MQALDAEEFDEILGSKPVIEECPLESSTVESIYHEFLGQLDFRLEGDPFLPALIFFEDRESREDDSLFQVDELCGDNVVGQDYLFSL